MALPFNSKIYTHGVRFLLSISGVDDTENREIYETYMHFGWIEDIRQDNFNYRNQKMASDSALNRSFF